MNSDDEPTEEEKFLLNLNQVRSKISHIWRPKSSMLNRKTLKEVRIKNVESRPTPPPQEDDNDQFTR